MNNKLDISLYYPNDEPNIYNDDNIPYDFLLNEYNGNFVIKNTNQYIKNIKKYIILEYSNLISLNVYYQNDNDINLYHLIKIIKRCYCIIKIYKLSKKINIHILMSPIKRYFPKNMTVDCNNINGGFTNINSNNIYILRKEEYGKVILHELIHHVDKLNNYSWDIKNLNKLKDKFNISKDTILAPNEALTELWAISFQLLFINYEYKIPFDLLLEIEIDRSLYLSYKLKKIQSNNYWKEKTNSFCYIIFKTILLYNFKKLLFDYKFPYNIDMITNFLIDNYTFPIIKKNNNKFISNNSMRMTVFGDF